MYNTCGGRMRWSQPSLRNALCRQRGRQRGSQATALRSSGKPFPLNSPPSIEGTSCPLNPPSGNKGTSGPINPLPRKWGEILSFEPSSLDRGDIPSYKPSSQEQGDILSYKPSSQETRGDPFPLNPPPGYKETSPPSDEESRDIQAMVAKIPLCRCSTLVF